jgi:hypothetical protein
LNTLTEQEKSAFLHSIHQDYDAFIKNNNVSMSRDVLNKEKSFKESLEELIKCYTNFDAQSFREASNKESSVINAQSTTLFSEGDVKHQKKHLKKKKKSSSDKKLDANNNNNDLIESDVFEFENFDEKSHDTYENNNTNANNKKYISHFDEANSSSQSSQSTDEVDEEEESDSDKTKKSDESGVLKKRNTNIENLGKFNYNSYHI